MISSYTIAEVEKDSGSLNVLLVRGLKLLLGVFGHH